MEGSSVSLGGIPGLAPVKKGIDPLLQWMPAWIHAAVWTVLVYVVLLVLGSLVVRKVIPWLADQFSDPVSWVINSAGVVGVLPEFLFTRGMRQLKRPAPSAAFAYSELVRSVTSGVQGGARIILSGLRALGKTPLMVLAVVLVLAFLGWDGAYCVGNTRCTLPTTQWVRSVSVAFSAHQPSPQVSPSPDCSGKHHRHRHHKSCETPSA